MTSYHLYALTVLHIYIYIQRLPIQTVILNFLMDVFNYLH